jgi:hypothetical protein
MMMGYTIFPGVKHCNQFTLKKGLPTCGPPSLSMGFSDHRNNIMYAVCISEEKQAPKKRHGIDCLVPCLLYSYMLQGGETRVVERLGYKAEAGEARGWDELFVPDWKRRVALWRRLF